MHTERVRQVMTTAVVSIDIDEPVTEAVRLFASYPMHHLPVVDESVVKGMLSSADMLKLEYFLPRAGVQPSAVLLNQRFRIATLMRSPVITADLEDTIGDAASRMVTHAIHALPVVNDRKQLLGIVTTTDVMQALLYGIGLGPRPERRETQFKPTELEIRRAIEAAESATLQGTDADGVAALMLYLKERNALLESLRLNVARFLHEGQDERLHARLVKDLDRLSQSGPLDI